MSSENPKVMIYKRMPSKLAGGTEIKRSTLIYIKESSIRTMIHMYVSLSFRE